MAISIGRADRHVQEWRAKLSRYPSTGGWGTSLYHACQIETAAEIIRHGELICRHNQQAIICDVANQGALWNNPQAHEFVRLYFRPKNRFHLKTEGIKSNSDTFRTNPHMAIPIMFVFDFINIMTMDDSYFVAGNFASQAMAPQQGDLNFDNLNFAYIYHDSPVSSDLMQTIQDARMAEVVIEKCLSLDNLRAVVCRTIHEERMLRYLLREDQIQELPIFVEKAGSVFFRRGMYVSELYTTAGVLHFQFTSPSTGAKNAYEVVVQCGETRHPFKLRPQRWRVPQIVNNDPDAVWRIEIEGCLAFEGPVPPTSPLVA